MDKRIFYTLLAGLIFLWLLVPAMALIFKSSGILHGWWAPGILSMLFGTATWNKNLH
jgi:hypothetical protein